MSPRLLDVLTRLHAEADCSPPKALTLETDLMTRELSVLYAEVGSAIIRTGGREAEVRAGTSIGRVVLDADIWIVLRLIDLPDDTFIAVGADLRGHVALVRLDEAHLTSRDPPWMWTGPIHEVEVVGPTLADVLASLLDDVGAPVPVVGKLVRPNMTGPEPQDASWLARLSTWLGLRL